MLLFEKDFYKWVENYDDLFDMFCEYSKNINVYYIQKLFQQTENKIVLYSIDTAPTGIDNCPCGLIYKLVKGENGKLEVYIMLAATQYKCRKNGYASLMMKTFIEYIREKYSPKYSEILIVLDSLESAVTFYEHLGFQWVLDTKYNAVFEIMDDENVWYEHFIMIYTLWEPRFP